MLLQLLLGRLVDNVVRTEDILRVRVVGYIVGIAIGHIDKAGESPLAGVELSYQAVIATVVDEGLAHLAKNITSVFVLAHDEVDNRIVVLILRI